MRFSLEISRVWGAVAPGGQGDEVGVVRGGPAELLAWLETQLGLGPPPQRELHRIAQYLRSIEAADGAAVSELHVSLAADRWETAAALLRQRDALRMGGWDGDPLPTASSTVAAIASLPPVEHGEPERLDAIDAALDAGQQLPAHRLRLLEPVENWPWRWRQLLQRLEPAVAERASPGAAADSALGQLQRALADGQIADIAPDDSLVWLDAANETSAVELVGVLLLADRSNASETVVVCAEPQLRLRLEHRLAALGLPTAGIRLATQAAPAFQVLPLAIELCRDAVPPDRLLEFLQLPVSPLPRRAARRLARALAEHPGMGSERWEEVWEALCCKEADPDASVRESLERWLPTGREIEQPAEPRAPEPCTASIASASPDAPRQRAGDGDDLAVAEVLKRCEMVAQWAREEAGRLAAQRPDRPPPLSTALLAAAEQAELVSELLQAEADGRRLRETVRRQELAQWIRAARTAVPLDLQPFECEVGAVRVVASLAEIRQPYDRLIWLGGSELAQPASDWSVHDVATLAVAGIEIEWPEAEARARISCEGDGFILARQRSFLVRVPRRDDRSECCVWTHLEACLAGGDRERHPIPMSELVGENFQHGALPIIRRTACHEPPQPARSNWRIALGALSPRSASELSDQLGCPLRWVFQRAAELAPAGNLRLPTDEQLAGTFCHQVLRRALEEDEARRCPAEAQRRVWEVFDQRIGRDAAVLATPAAAAARGRLRQQLGGATRRLVELLQAGAYTGAAFEVPFEVSCGERSADGGQGSVIRGRIDCLGWREDGREVVIDFKFGGDARRREEIRLGRAVQLAIYAYSRFRATGHFPAVAYLILSTAQVHTPRDSCPLGMAAAECDTGPPIESVWRSFTKALNSASHWTDGKDLVPCRPLQPVSQWPEGVELVLEAPRGKRDEAMVQSICRYCDYGSLCGRISLE